jgi:hypothetical protein
MKHIRTYDSYRNIKSKFSSVDPSAFDEAIKESVLQVGDVYKVRSMVDIPQSLINSYVKKVKDTTGKNLRQFFGDVEIAEQLLQYITTTGLDLDKIPGGALMGQAQAQVQGTQVQVDVAQTTTDEVPAAQTTETPTAQTTETPTAQTTETPAQTQVQVQTAEAPVAQPASDEFEEPAQVQTTQGQTQEEEEEEKENEEEENEEELPL